MTIEGGTVDEFQIRQLIAARSAAVRDKDIDGLMSNLAPDVISFDVVNPLHYVGLEATRRRAEEWLSSFRGPIRHEIRGLSITAGDEAAFSHCLTRVSGTTLQGVEVDMWLRSTVCYRKFDAKWMITHQHNSVPFDAESGRASLDLQP